MQSEPTQRALSLGDLNKGTTSRIWTRPRSKSAPTGRVANKTRAEWEGGVKKSRVSSRQAWSARGTLEGGGVHSFHSFPKGSIMQSGMLSGFARERSSSHQPHHIPPSRRPAMPLFTRPRSLIHCTTSPPSPHPYLFAVRPPAAMPPKNKGGSTKAKEAEGESGLGGYIA